MLRNNKGPFTQRVSVSVNANANARMGTTPIHFAVLVLPLTLMLMLTVYVNSLIAVCKDSYVVYACGFDRNGK